MATYTDTDWARASALGPFTDKAHRDEVIAQLIADVRNETIERCAVELERRGHVGAPYVLRALKDGAK